MRTCVRDRVRSMHKSMSPDIEKYRRFVERFDLAEEAKAELIHTVWRIMESFVDRAFERDPVQQIQDSIRSKDASEEAAVIECDDETMGK